MNCPECGNHLEPNAPSCPKCFARIEPPGFWRRLFSLFQSSSKPRRPIVTITKTVNVKTTDTDGQQHEYHSLEEVPPEILAQLEKLESQPLKQRLRSSSSDDHSIHIKTEKTFSEFRIKDASGNERVYHSVEELPPEIRAALEQAQNKAKE